MTAKFGGVVLGGALAVAFYSSAKNANCGDSSGWLAGVAAIGGISGLAIGLLVGGVTKRDKWGEVPVPAAEPPPVAKRTAPPEFGLGVGPDGSVKLAFSLRL